MISDMDNPRRGASEDYILELLRQLYKEQFLTVTTIEVREPNH
jgi:hypothetical protein